MLAEIGDNYSKRLSAYFPHHNKFFFGTSGSDGIETAIRLTYMARLKQKSTKNKIVTVRGSYHGSTWLTGAISDLGGLGQHLPEWPDALKITSPFGNDGFNTLQELKALNANEISCIVIEPFTYLSGVLETSKEFWKELELWCVINDVYLILDECASGFYKTGSMFYYNKVGIVPTFVCMSKSITAGYAPLSSVAILNHVWNIIKDDWIVHGWTNSGSTIALAAADASLSIFESMNYDNQYLIEEFLSWLKNEHEITTTRQIGNFFAFEMKSRKWRRDVGVRFANVALKHDLQLTTFKYDAVARGLIPLNATGDYFEELKEKVSLVVNDKELLRSSIINTMSV
jgi:adenosylmethionine-8-amino-7-oxononanoate aminotransferase